QAARGCLARARPNVVLLDVVEFEGSDRNGPTAALQTLLAELKACTPPALALVLAEGQSTRDRARLAQLGGRGFLPRSALPAQVMETVSQLLQQERSATTRILAVDDDRVVLAALRQLLLPWGMELFSLDDPRQFWETLETVAPDLLILDVAMPHINGIELCQIVRNDVQWGSLPVLFLTARADADTKQAVFAAGADDYLCKPIVGPEVVARISNRLERSRLLRNWRSADPLTGLANRQQATGDLEQLLQLAKRNAQPLCLAVLAADDLQNINLQFGPAVGDRILSHLGMLLQRAFQGDVTARWSGAKFAIGIYGMVAAEGVQRLTATLSELRSATFPGAEGATVRASFSAGLAVFPKDGNCLPALYQAATDALQRARTTGGDRIACTRALEEDTPWDA
ncbi:MAG: response regulator, partial [Cyanobacteria bacterium J06641_5]